MSEREGDKVENVLNEASINEMRLLGEIKSEACSPNDPTPFLSELLLRDDNMKQSTFVFNVFSRLVFALLVFCLALFLQGLLIYASDWYYQSGEASLKDRVHAIFGKTSPPWAPVSYVNSMCAVYMVITLLRFTLFVDWKLSFTILTRFFLMISFLYLVRGVAISVTTLPSPVLTCVPLRSTGFLDTVKGVVFMTVGIKYGCTDLVISGHTLFVTSLTIIWIYYSANSKLTLAALLSFWLVILLSIDISFFHYSVDIIMGIWYATTSWIIYHFLLDMAATILKQRMYSNSQATDYIASRYSVLRHLALFLAKLEGLDCRMKYIVDTEYSTWMANKAAPTQGIVLSSRSVRCSMDDVTNNEEGIHGMAGYLSKSEYAEELLSDPKFFVKVYFGDGAYCCNALLSGLRYAKTVLEKLWRRI